MKIKKVDSPSLKDNFIKSIETDILSGNLKPGDRLPTERELAERHAVSKTVINTGIQEMVGKGFLEVRPRSGTFVSDYLTNGTLNTLISVINCSGEYMSPETIKDLIILYATFDRLLLHLISGKISGENYRNLSSLIEKIGNTDSPTEAASLNYNLKHEIALLSGNSLLPLIYAAFKPATAFIWERYCRKYGTIVLYENARTMLDLLRDGNTSAAENALTCHVRELLTGNRQVFYE